MFVRCHNEDDISNNFYESKKNLAKRLTINSICPLRTLEPPWDLSVKMVICMSLEMSWLEICQLLTISRNLTTQYINVGALGMIFFLIIINFLYHKKMNFCSKVMKKGLILFSSKKKKNANTKFLKSSISFLILRLGAPTGILRGSSPAFKCFRPLKSLELSGTIIVFEFKLPKWATLIAFLKDLEYHI